MNRVDLNPDLAEYDGKVRVEAGPARITAEATESLLADTVTHPMYKVGGKDAAGNVIVLGQPMQYLDFLGPRGWYVYRREADAALDAEHWDDVTDGVAYRWMPKGYFATRDEAEAAVPGLL